MHERARDGGGGGARESEREQERERKSVRAHALSLLLSRASRALASKIEQEGGGRERSQLCSIAPVQSPVCVRPIKKKNLQCRNRTLVRNMAPIWDEKMILVLSDPFPRN